MKTDFSELKLCRKSQNTSTPFHFFLDRVSEYLSPDQLQDHLATLSGLPPTFFSAFLQLDAIKRRNAEAMHSYDDSEGLPPQLPFFLPAIETSTGMAWLDDDKNEEVAEETISKSSGVDEQTEGVSKRRRKRDKKALDLEASLLNGGTSLMSSLLGGANTLDATDNEKCE